jgi:hypothetical protein
MSATRLAEQTIVRRVTTQSQWNGPSCGRCGAAPDPNPRGRGVLGYAFIAGASVSR